MQQILFDIEMQETYIKWKFQEKELDADNSKVQKCFTCTVFKFAQNKCLTYMNKVFRPAENIRINTRNSYLKLKHPNWLYKTILRLNHLSKAELLLFSARSFSKLYFLFSLMWHFKTYPRSASTSNKITIIY